MASGTAARGAAPVATNGSTLPPTELRLQNKRKRTSDTALVPPPSTRIRHSRVGTSRPVRVPNPPKATLPKPPTHIDYRLHSGVGAPQVLGYKDEAEVIVRVHPKFLTLNNVAVRARQLWGSDVYTDDSDIICLLQHTGHFALTDQEVQGSRFDYLSVRVCVKKYPPHCPGFESRERNGIRSRAWGTQYEGACISITSVSAVKDGKETILAKSVLAGLRSYIPYLLQWGASDSATLSSDVALSFDLLNEPCLCYNLAAVADKSFDPSLWPSRRLSTEVMYLENAGVRYELAAMPRVGSGDGGKEKGGMRDSGDETEGGKKKEKEGREEKGEEEEGEDGDEGEKENEPLLLRWSRVKDQALDRLRLAGSGAPDRRKRATKAKPLARTPLAEEDLDILAVSVKWADLQWNPDGVTVSGIHYPLRKLVFKPISKSGRAK